MVCGAQDVAHNTLWVVQGHDHPWLQSPMQALDASWVAGSAPALGSYGAKTRYRRADATCVLAPNGEGAFALAFNEPHGR